MPVATQCQHLGCDIITVGEFCVDHEAPAAPRVFPRGRPFPAPARVHVGVQATAALTRKRSGVLATVARGEPLFYLWLRACQGFRVFGPSGQLGVVESIARGWLNEITGVRIRHGLFERGLSVVLLDRIDSISPATRRLLVGESELVPVRSTAPQRSLASRR